MNQKTKKLGIVGVVAVALALVVTGVLTSAESGDAAAAAGSASDTTSFLAKVAKYLGIEETKLESAIEAAREQEIDEAVAAGRITEEQATAMREHMAAERAMEQLMVDGVASGKITQAQADLLGAGGRGPRGGAMGGQGLLGAGRGLAPRGCEDAGRMMRPGR